MEPPTETEIPRSSPYKPSRLQLLVHKPVLILLVAVATYTIHTICASSLTEDVEATVFAWVFDHNQPSTDVHDSPLLVSISATASHEVDIVGLAMVVIWRERSEESWLRLTTYDQSHKLTMNSRTSAGDSRKATIGVLGYELVSLSDPPSVPPLTGRDIVCQPASWGIPRA